ncbi:hypothetical protein DAEQUDRAFT_441149 [Daedalea quercina L-15889]|uniref:Uncharacterized protein n=1 Tax=Daedalea quercina L-15889 TaxID=1314783 RepID=A0A165NCA3_9APHY|nr:hypothetical protein DAEQUDRAFT_441149 [Daedalea quercina L-15889]
MLQPRSAASGRPARPSFERCTALVRQPCDARCPVRGVASHHASSPDMLHWRAACSQGYMSAGAPENAGQLLKSCERPIWYIDAQRADPRAAPRSAMRDSGAGACDVGNWCARALSAAMPLLGRPRRNCCYAPIMIRSFSHCFYPGRPNLRCSSSLCNLRSL